MRWQYSRRALSLLVLVALGPVVLSGTAVAQDQFEPNDDFETATELSAGEYDGLTIESGESDYFVVDLEAGEGLNATIRARDGTDLDMRMYAPNRSQIGSSASFSGTEALAVASDQGGTYYVEVYGFVGATGTYSLSLTTGEDIETNLGGVGAPSTGPSVEPDQFEENDDLTTAAEVAPGEYEGLTVEGSESDYFSVSLAPGEGVRASVSSDTTGSDIDMAMYAPNRSQIGSSASFSSDESLAVASEQGGTYYVEVYGFVGASNATYSLSLTTGDEIETNLGGVGSGPDTDPTGPSLDPDQYEPNNDIGTATTVSDSEYEDLTIESGESDYFAVDLSQGETLTATIRFDANQGDLDMRAYGPDQTEQNASAGTFSDNESVSLTATQAGTYYVETYGFGSASAEYSLELSGTGAPAGDGSDGGDETDTSDGTDDSDDGSDGTDGDDGSDGDDGADGGDGSNDAEESGDGGDDSGDSSGPGFGLLAALIGLCGAGYLARRA
jgi:PGF-CTERM protein